MKVAYLIIAHNDPNQLKRLIGALNVKNAFFFVHIDLKSPIKLFKNVIDNENIKFIEQRICTSWGGYSLLSVIVRLLEEALSAPEEYDRLVVLSGLDYPIMSNNEIFNFFEKHKDVEFIIAQNISDGTPKGQIERVTRYWFFDCNKWVRRLLNYIALVLPIRKKKYVYYNNKNNKMYSGSDWWALTAGCAKYICKTLNTEQKLQEYLKTSFAPSEIFAQTIIMNSDFSNKILKCIDNPVYLGLEALTPLHYIEYGKSIKVYDETDFDTLINSGKMFFRKAMTGKSEKLLDKIDKYRASKDI